MRNRTLWPQLIITLDLVEASPLMAKVYGQSVDFFYI